MVILYSLRAYVSHPTRNKLPLERPLIIMKGWSWLSICSDLSAWCDSGLLWPKISSPVAVLRLSIRPRQRKKLSYYLMSRSMAHSSGNRSIRWWRQWSTSWCRLFLVLATLVGCFGLLVSMIFHYVAIPCTVNISEFSLVRHSLYSRYFGSFTTQGSTSSITRIRQEMSSQSGWISVSPSQPNEHSGYLH